MARHVQMYEVANTFTTELYCITRDYLIATTRMDGMRRIPEMDGWDGYHHASQLA